MIAENLRDILEKVTSIPALTASAGLALGGKGTDPGMIKVPLPAAWIMYVNDKVDEAPFGSGGYQPGMVPASEVVLVTVKILIYVPYIDQDDLLNTQFPLLESVALAIRGTLAPSGHRWRYNGQVLALVYPDRLGYEQQYTLTAML